MELLLLNRLGVNEWETLAGGKGLKVGQRLQVENGPAAEIERGAGGTTPGRALCRARGALPSPGGAHPTAAVHPHTAGRPGTLPDSLRPTARIGSRPDRRAALHPGAAGQPAGGGRPPGCPHPARWAGYFCPGERRSTCPACHPQRVVPAQRGSSGGDQYHTPGGRAHRGGGHDQCAHTGERRPGRRPGRGSSAVRGTNPPVHPSRAHFPGGGC